MPEDKIISNLLLPDINDLLGKREYAIVKDFLSNTEIADVAEIFAGLSDSNQILILRILPPDRAADVFEFIETAEQIKLLEKLGHVEAAELLNEMSPDDRTELMEEAPPIITKNILDLLNKEERDIALRIMGYPEDSVGRLLTNELISVTKDKTVSEVFNFIREKGKNSETINVIYVVDQHGMLLDDLKLRDLIFAEQTTLIENLCDGNFVSLNVLDDQEIALGVFKKYDRIALPVTDSRGYLVGIVTVDDMLDVAEEEATEDIQKFGGTDSLDEPYISIRLFRMIKKRSVWLSMLFIGEMFTATAMAFFEDEISKAVVLAMFVPLIISSGGNSGSQAATLVVRSLALSEISIKNWLFVLKRELLSGLILGSILATIGFIRISVWQLVSGIYGSNWYLIGLTVSISLIGVVTWGTLVGGLLPIILKKIGLDPATSSAPFVATLVDVFGIVIYFSVAFFILKGILL